MAGIIPPGGAGGVGPTGDPSVSFANEVASAEGLDPRVVYAWEKAEGHPGDLPGYFNYLNIAAATAAFNRDPISGVGPAGTAKFGSLTRGVTAAEHEIEALGLGQMQGLSPAQQIARIAASGWASSHYGGPGGPNLLADFEHLYGKGAAGKADNTPLPSAGGGASGAQTKLDIGGWLGSLFDFLKGYALRVAEVVGGGVLIVAGLFILARGAGVAPVPV